MTMTIKMIMTKWEKIDQAHLDLDNLYAEFLHRVKIANKSEELPDYEIFVRRVDQIKALALRDKGND